MKTTEITKQNFENLLDWLDPDRERAGRRYEIIRERLVRIFNARGCFIADELADETIDRVVGKVGDLSKTYRGDPALFFYGVAKNVFLEYTRRPKFEELSPSLKNVEITPDESNGHQECLEKCLEKTALEQRNLILAYYEGRGQERINRRKQLQIELGISSEAVRVKALRIRLVLQNCVLKCMDGGFSLKRLGPNSHIEVAVHNG